ncbi:DUF3108 domain-containing protein [Nonlabens marinus]|uniref:ATP-dependent exoDNAse (Exonuclease V) alpha subunit-helicase superfamily I member n=1 Tax=Nonlabens marinus S1-08 TaxID=1454201 RepID=W8VPM0_9FLAO|nr:DUF3108 domain-containing protein [Nonlabens marinus]BAO54565.1 ATP-dependent exoDNAse (exonuclease V) alpha subunit - helicase superfamily I member [Nonlabens marinus S1-08]
MKRIIPVLLTLFTISVGFAPAYETAPQRAYADGEWFKFRIHYGMFNASYATLEVKDTKLNGKKVYHLKGKGKSTGLMHLFFEVNDRYESYIDKETGAPYRFIRDIDEGGHTKDIQIDFDHATKVATINNKKRKEITQMSIKPGTQDMISAFYHLRNIVDATKLKKNDEFIVPMFFDNENYDFKMKFLEREVVRTKFGKINALKFRPYVQSGRVFEEEESLTVWISDDENKLPLKIQAKLAVGSLTADLDAFKGLSHSFKKIAD